MDFDFNTYIKNQHQHDVTESKPLWNNKHRKKLSSSRRRKIRSVLQKITSVAHEIFDIYNAVKHKDPISIGLAAMSTYNVVDGLIDYEQETAQDLFDKMGAELIFPTMGLFIRMTLKNMGISCHKLWERENYDNKQPQERIEEFDIGEKVYFCISGEDDANGIRGPWLLDKNRFISRFSGFIKERLGNILAVDIVVKDWDNIPFLTDIDLESKIYVSHIDEDEFLVNIRKFYDKGLNRSLLFFGPPGSGKTTLAARIAKKMKGRLLVVAPESLEQLRFSALSNVIDIADPSVVLFDDMDRMWRPEDMLNKIEQLNRKVRTRNRLIIATVNNVEEIPQALRRPGRFDEIVEFTAPEKKRRKEILEAYANHEKLSLSAEQMDEMVELTDGMTGAYLREIVIRTSVIGYDQMPSQINYMRKVASMPDIKSQHRNSRDHLQVQQ